MKKFIFMLAVLMIFSCTALAKTVTVTGEGVAASDAENDAFRMAVENTLGVLVDSQTLVEKNMVIQDSIYTQSRGFITDYKVISRTQTGNGWQVTITATVDDNPNSKLMSELTRLGIINVQLRNPKIAVYVPEQHIQYRVPDPAGETAIVKALINAGFSQVTEVGSRMTVTNPMKMSANELTSAAQKFGVDIIIVGEAFSEGVGDPAQWLPGNQNSNMQACRARVEAKMFIARTGQIIAADGKFASGMDNSQAIASKKALAKAGQQMGEYFVEQITGLYTNNQSVEVVVYGADFSKINRVQTAIRNVRGVKNVNLSSYENGRAVFTVMYGGSPQALFSQIDSQSDLTLNLQSISYNTLTISVR